jgi:hypothetical protein
MIRDDQLPTLYFSRSFFISDGKLACERTSANESLEGQYLLRDGSRQRNSRKIHPVKKKCEFQNLLLLKINESDSKNISTQSKHNWFFQKESTKYFGSNLSSCVAKI